MEWREGVCGVRRMKPEEKENGEEGGWAAYQYGLVTPAAHHPHSVSTDGPDTDGPYSYCTLAKQENRDLN